MTLIVEDGTGKADAESYASVEQADAYHAGRGNTAWAALSSPVKEQCLRKATDYLAAYRQIWDGSRYTVAQALDWPRAYVERKDAPLLAYYPFNEVPAGVVNACALLALKASAGDLSPDLDRGVLREKIGPIETEYDPRDRQARRHVEVDRLLAPYLSPRGYCVPLRRG